MNAADVEQYQQFGQEENATLVTTICESTSPQMTCEALRDLLINLLGSPLDFARKPEQVLAEIAANSKYIFSVIETIENRAETTYKAVSAASS